MRIIRGFSQATGYDCSSCHLKCCATDYNLPLLPKESIQLRSNYRYLTSIFQKRGKNIDFLLRGDSCPFLDENGLCNLHDTPDKPIICHIYPLIFWKINEELILTWINPCRGNGFRWIAEEKSKIHESQINDLFEKSKDKFKIYIGEFFDRDNPYEGITEERITVELKFLEKVLSSEKKSFLEIATETIDDKIIDSVIQPLIKTLDGKKSIEILDENVNSVFHWLCWSPVGLQLSLNNSKLIFLIAGLWIKKLKYESITSGNEDRLYSQLSSFMATAILPSFWRQISKNAEYYELKTFSRNVVNILEGKIPQQELLTKLVEKKR